MGIFGASTYDSDVEKATSEANTSEQWDHILDVCDKAGKSTEESKNYLRAILKRLNNPDPHIGVQAATLLDACVSNCGKIFHIEVASRDFENEFSKLLKKSHPQVVQKLKESLKKWAENEFRTDQQLNLIPSLYSKLKNSGIEFNTETPVKKSIALSKDPNVVQSQDEEDQIAKAIELSLKETTGSPRNTMTSSLYPSANLATATANVAPVIPEKEPRKVRALYDFEAAEDNELTFSTGEIILVTDDSDANWWKGSNQRGEGLFPASFVTADLSAEPDQFLYEKAKKNVQFNETVEVKAVENDLQEVEIDEGKIDRLLHLLHEADPTNPDEDGEEMLKLEREVNTMGPLIDTELERVDRKHAQLTQLSANLVDALSLYHTLMREPQFPSIAKIPYSYPVTSHPPNAMVYNNNMPPTSGGVPFGPQFTSPERAYMHPSQLPSHLQMQMDAHLAALPGHLNRGPPGSGPSQFVPPPCMGGMPMSTSLIMPPGMQHAMNEQRLPPGPTMSHFPQGMPNFGPSNIPPFPPGQMQQMGQQNATPTSQTGSFPQTPNSSHIM